MISSTILSAEDIGLLVRRLGFLPFFANGIEGFSIEECTPKELWFADDVEGPWDWKSAVMHGWNCAYGKFFAGKAGFVSMEWMPDLVNYRRSQYSLDKAPLDSDGRNREREVYNLVIRNELMSSKDIKKACPFFSTSRRIKPLDVLDDLPKRSIGTGYETVMTRLQMATLLVTADIDYLRDRNGHPYGWGIACYATPEATFGADILNAYGGRTPAQSCDRIAKHLKSLLPDASDKQIDKIVG